ncbi:MAG: bifunctional hydroxymethylpyrimidine kinase/phosphomethylpyrimidine kinase [Gemmatimonadetes bacterium]|nr:bifunctional hydroxymethylpyrimidine kinase/phosphomethylpyrimidine kinase [Gemmatimonadota bacterium]
MSGAQSRTPAVALTIAGSDSGGGAGIQADLKTFHAFGVFGTSAITAVTAQNTLGVQAVHAVPAPVVEAQIRAVARDLHPAAVKTGMLATRELVAAVAGAIRDERLVNYVLDPVMVASSGDPLLDAGAESAILELLVPLATCVTPNLDEAERLTGMRVRTPDAMRAAAERLVQAGARAALIKGGHLDQDEILDVFWDGRRLVTASRPRIATRSTHGTGCTLSAAIAAGLAKGMQLEAAVHDALDFVHRAIHSAPGLGAGNGPLNHFTEPRSTHRPPTSAEG